MPITSLTLAGAKQYLALNFAQYKMKKTSALHFGLDMWEVNALEEVPNSNSLRTRNFRLYTQGIEDDSLAWWEATQGPVVPTPAPPLPTFRDQLLIFLREEVSANRFKIGVLTHVDNEMERAIATVVDSAGMEKRVIIKKEGLKFVMEDYTPL